MYTQDEGHLPQSAAIIPSVITSQQKGVIMKRCSKTLALVFSLLLIVMMIPALPGAAYADDSPSVQPVESKAEVAEDQTPMVYLDREARRLNQIISNLQAPTHEARPPAKGPIALDTIEFSAENPAAGTYLFAWVKDVNGDYPDPNEIVCKWYYKDGDGWSAISEADSDIEEHIIIVPGYARGKCLMVTAEPKDTSSYIGTLTATTNPVISSRLDLVELNVLGAGCYVGNKIEPYAYYKAEGKIFLLDDTYIHYDYYVGEGNSWTQIPEGVYNNDSYIPFEAEGKFIKVVAHVMAEQDDVLGGPVSYVTDERTWVYPIKDNFHDETLPSGWVALSDDDDWYTWENMEDHSFPSLSGDIDGECIGSASWYSGVGALDPDNWLISPSFYVPNYASLEFYVTGTDSVDNKEHFGVYVSTDPFLEFYNWQEVYSETISTYKSYEKKVVDLSAYAGKSIHIAFRHYQCPDQFWLLLDGVSISSPIVRISGKTRYDTSIDIANRCLSIKERYKYPLIFVTTGDDFPDALSGSSISIAYDAPVLLISPTSVATQEKALNYIENHLSNGGGVVILGGTGAVPKSFEDKLDKMYVDSYSPLGYWDRVSGKDRYKTNLEILKIVYNKTGSDRLLVCDGTNYADAATASAVGLPVMLVPKAGLTSEQKAFLDSFTETKYIYVIGGKAAVSDYVLNQLAPYDYYGKPERLSGKNRAETAVEVARFFVGEYNVTDAVLAYGGNFPDCIAGGLLANWLEAPILYGDGAVNSSFFKADDPYFQTNTYLSKAYILGGPALVSDNFASALLAKG